MQSNKRRKLTSREVGIQQLKITSFFSTLKPDKTSIETLQSNGVDKIAEKADSENSLVINPNSAPAVTLTSSKATKSKWSPFPESGMARKSENRCPFYKRIPDTTFVVDAFNYGCIPGITAYFLSHFHSDHYTGLNSKFKQALYCNKVTANLVSMKLRVRGEFIHVLPMDKACFVNGIEITLIDANHCPGSAMFLFRYSDGRTLLHTGDFRATSSMEKHPMLLPNQINTLYLDTTYCKPLYQFPEQQVVLDKTVQMACSYYKDNPRTLFVCGSYTIGKEKVFIAIAKVLGLKVWSNKEKARVLNCLEDTYLSSIMTPDENEAQIHVLPLYNVNFEFLNDYHKRFKHSFNQIVGLKPSGWEFNGKSSSQELKYRKQGKIVIYGIPYSEHSSYNELEKFVQYINPDRIIPTVNVTGKAGHKTNEILHQWTTKKANPQQSLDRWSQKRNP